jgi:hypothetical protein
MFNANVTHRKVAKGNRCSGVAGDKKLSTDFRRATRLIHSGSIYDLSDGCPETDRIWVRNVHSSSPTAFAHDYFPLPGEKLNQ